MVYLQNVRLSFPSLDRATAYRDQGIKKYKATFICDPTSRGVADFKKYIHEITTEWRNGRFKNALVNIENERRNRCYSSGNEHVNKTTLLVYDGYEGKFIITANNVNKPQFITREGELAHNDMEIQECLGDLYPGCYVNVMLQPWLQDSHNEKGIRCSLLAIQFAAEGEHFGESISNTEIVNQFSAVSARVEQSAAPIALVDRSTDPGSHSTSHHDAPGVSNTPVAVSIFQPAIDPAPVVDNNPERHPDADPGLAEFLK